MDSQQRFSEIEARVHRGEQLSFDDGCFLFRPEVDLHAVGRLADQVRHRLNGDRVYYNINAHLNPTNICRFRCPLCAYSCDSDDSRAFCPVG